MIPNSNFESLCFDLFVVHDTFNKANRDPDVIFMHNNCSSFEARYTSPDKISSQFNFSEEFISDFHFNIKIMKKNFEAFQEFFDSLKFKFSIMFLGNKG